MSAEENARFVQKGIKEQEDYSLCWEQLIGDMEMWFLYRL